MHEIPFTIFFCIQRRVSVIDYFAYADTCAHREPIFFVSVQNSIKKSEKAHF